MLKTLFLIIIISISSFAMENLTPKKIYKATGDVQSLVIYDEKLYAGTSNGTVEIFNIRDTSKISSIKIDDIKDFMGDNVSSKIYSIDVLNEDILITSQGEQGFRNIYLYSNNSLNKLIDIKSNYLIQKAKFIDKDHLVFALLSNQIGLYDISKKSLIYLTQIGYSSFSDFALSEDKKTLVTTDESGVVKLFDVKKGQVLKEFEGINLDKVYQLDYKNDVVLTAGQDRKAVVFKNDSNKSLSFDFLLYSCALSANANYSAIAYNEQNDVLIFDTNSLKYLYNLTGQKSTLTQILFKNDYEVFVSSENSQINYFNLKGE